MTGPRIAAVPGLSLERELVESGARFVGGMDEVGRGAFAGPVSVGLVVLDVAVLDAADPTPWAGIRDSKTLTPKRRQMLEPAITTWATSCTVGHAQPWEIDAWGINAALRLAGLRALDRARARGIVVDALILDGPYNWLAPRPVPAPLPDPGQPPPEVHPVVRADVHCVSVAAASVAAKVERDRIMQDHAQQFPQYGWATNKGYGSAAHRAALREHGVTPLHRTSWKLGL